MNNVAKGLSAVLSGLISTGGCRLFGSPLWFAVGLGLLSVSLMEIRLAIEAKED